MTDIPNIRHITINKDGVFVNGQHTRSYNGSQIHFIESVKSQFAEIQRQYPELQELHVGAFETAGNFATSGNPSGNFGRNAWVRVKMSDGRLGPWVFSATYNSSFECAIHCALDGEYNICYYSSMRSEVLKFAKKYKEKTMTDIPKTQYITINKNGVFVGGQHAISYNGAQIHFIESVKSQFAKIQRQNPEVQELHVGAFETSGIFAQYDNPSGKFGKYAWARVKMADGRLGAWVFSDPYGSTFECAAHCAHDCVCSINYYSAMRSAMLKFADKDKQR